MCGMSRVSSCSLGDFQSLIPSQKVRFNQEGRGQIQYGPYSWLTSSSYLTLPPLNGNPLRSEWYPDCSWVALVKICFMDLMGL